MPSKLPFEIHPGKFSLNVSGVAGFFGGDEAISAIQTIHIYKARKFLGWYNSPGSWNVGKKFGMLANSRFWDGLFPGPNEKPAKSFQLDGKQGPKYVASRSGTILEHTGHLAYLIMQKSKEEQGVKVKGRITKRNKVTIIKTQPFLELSAESGTEEEAPKEEEETPREDEEKTREEEKPPKDEPLTEIPPRSGHHTLVAILPIVISFTTCALCGCTYDWFCFSMILLGIVSSGMSSLVLGSARLKLQGVNSAPTAPPGDGMLMDGDDIVLLLGKEEIVATITRGRFVLEYAPWVRWRSRKGRGKRSVLGDGMESTNSDRRSDAESGQNSSGPKQEAVPLEQVAVPLERVAAPLTQVPNPDEEPVRDEYAAIGVSSLLLVIQLLAQLLLIPQGTFFGQIMFLSSFAASWAYNLYLSSIDNEYIQEKLLLEVLYLKEKHMRTYTFGTRTTAAVFACLMLQPRDDSDIAHKYVGADKWENLGFQPESIIRNFMPNNTHVWVTWREKVLEIMRTRDSNQDTRCGLLQMSDKEKTDFEPADIKLLAKLLEDARTAYDLATNEQLQGWLKENQS